MFGIMEILGLIIAVGGIATLARGRGASPLAAGVTAVAGWALIEIGGGPLVVSDNRVWLIVAGWAWIGGVALFVRFVIGARRPKPDGKWNCSDCRYLNNASSVVCEACGRPWQSTGSSSQSAQA